MRIITQFLIFNDTRNENLGYLYTYNKDEFEVKVEDLPLNSHVEVDCICDGCGKELKPTYKDYNKNKKDNNIYCRKCSNKIFGVNKLLKTMLKIVKLNPNKLNYMNTDGSLVSIPRPSAIPFNVINMNKIKAAGYANGITMVIFMDDKFKPANEIHFFRMVPNDIVEGLINGVATKVEDFLKNALDGVYPDYIEENRNYFM